MKIRTANKFDTPYILDMLKNYRGNTPIEILKNANNEEYVSKMLRHVLLGGGLCLIAEKDEPIGFIVGIITNNMWDPDIKILEELAYWVEPSHRGSTAGYRLLKEYNTIANTMLEEKKIHWHTISKMINSPDLDYERFGYRKIEEKWVAGV